MLIFVRHGQTDWNAIGRFQGHIDIPLNDVGRAQAQRNGLAIREYLSHVEMTVDQFEFVSSPLSRTRETMEIIRMELGLPAQGTRFDDRLIEIAFGEAEGKTMDEMAQDMPGVYAGRQADKWGYQMPGGESYAMVRDRVENWMRDIQPPMIVVTHGGTGRVIRGELMGLETAEIPQLETPQDKFYLWRDDQGAWL